MTWTFELDKINDVAKSCLPYIERHHVIALHGEMGAGKTTFVHAICESMGVKDIVGSPTFSIINEYNYSSGGKLRKLFHIDLYRLKDEQEAIEAGIEDCLNSGEICLVEWPDRAPGIFPENTLHLYLKVVGTETRKLEINNN